MAPSQELRLVIARISPTRYSRSFGVRMVRVLHEAGRVGSVDMTKFLFLLANRSREPCGAAVA